MKQQEIRCTHKRRKSAGAEGIACNNFLLAGNNYEIYVKCRCCKGFTRVTVSPLGLLVGERVFVDTRPVLKEKPQ